MGLNTKVHLAVFAHGVPVGIFITSGATTDCSQAEALIEGIAAKVLLADKGYDSDAIVKCAEELGMQVVIPPRSNRKVQREYDKELYKLRHFVENAFILLKRWRGIASDMQRKRLHFWRLCIFDAWPFGRKSHDDTI